MDGLNTPASLGLAGSSLMTAHLQAGQAARLIDRINAAQASIANLSGIGREMTSDEDARYDAAEAEIELCRPQLRRLVADRLGVDADTLWSALL